MAQVFGCPHCQNPFQVPDDAAGQTFTCPSCETPVEIPESETPEVEQPEPDVFQCPHCLGQFGINSAMYGQQLSCPHCEQIVAVGEEPHGTVPAPAIETEEPVEFEEEAPEIDFESHPQPNESEESNTSEDTESAAESVNASAIAEPPSEAAQPDPTPEPEPTFEVQPVDHLIPPTFNVPDPVRFPARLDAEEVFLPDGKGGYKKVDANIVTITHRGEVYHLKRMTPQERRRRSLIHNSIAIAAAVILIYLTLKTIGLVS